MIVCSVSYRFITRSGVPERRMMPSWECGSRRLWRLPPHVFALYVRGFHKDYPRSIQGLTLVSPVYTAAPVREKDGSSHLWPFFDSARLTRRVWSKGSQEKNKYVQRAFCLAPVMPLPLSTTYAQWCESQRAVSPTLRAQIRPSYDDYCHKSPRHPDKQLRLKLEIESNIHSQRFPNFVTVIYSICSDNRDVTEL